MKNDKIFNSTYSEYKVIDSIGSGGSGHVYKVKNEEDILFALKTLSVKNCTKDKLKRFKNESYFGYNYKHKNIIEIIDYGFSLETKIKVPFYVMPYYSMTLRAIMDSGIDHNRIMPIIFQILNGLKSAHAKGIWHRDIKPENILYDTSGDSVKIADFGIAHFTEDFLATSIETKHGSKMANFKYAAPEQKSHNAVIDQRADIFAIGLMLNEMFTGHIPSGTGFKKISEVSKPFNYLDIVVENMIRYSVDERFNNIDDVIKDIIAREKVYVSSTQLSELEKTTIEDVEIDDPHIKEPVKILNVDFYNGNVKITLNHKINANWMMAFRNIGSYTSIPYTIEPHLFNFNDNIASINIRTANPKTVQQAVDYFKDYTAKAEVKYLITVKENIRQQKLQKEMLLREKIQIEKNREEILKQIKY